MSKFRKYFVAVFATLLAVAASATDVPYGKNLLQNTNPDGTTFDPWVLTKNSGSGWAISDGKFCSSYFECVLTQILNLKDLGLTTEQTDSLTMLSMVNYEILWPGKNKCIAKVIITCKDSAGNNLSEQSLLDINQSKIEVSATLVNKSFLLPKGTTQLVYEMHGKDQVSWGGQYGPRFWSMYVGFVENMTKTYTASAVATLGDSLVLSKTAGIKVLDTIDVTSKYSDVRIKILSSENSNVISSNQVVCMGADMTINAEFYRKHSIVASASEYGTITIKKDMAFYGDTIVVSHTMNSDTVLFAGYTTTPDINWLTDSTFIMVDENVTVGMEVYRRHSIVASASEYGTIAIKKDAAIYGDTVIVSHTMNCDTVRFAGYATTPNVNWLNDSTFIMVDEDVTIGMEVYRKHSIVATSEYGTITIKKDMAFYGDTIVVSHTMNGDTVFFVDYTTTPNLNWLTDSTFVMVDEDVTIGMKVYRKHSIVASAFEYGTITIKKDAAFYGDTITVSHTMNTDTVRFAGYTTMPDLTWVNDTTFIMPNENVIIGMEVYKKHSIVFSSEYGTITFKKDSALYGDTIIVRHTMKSGYIFRGYITTPNLTRVDDSTFIMPDEDVTIGMEVMKVNEIPFYEGFENGNTQGQNIAGWLQQSLSGYNSWYANSTEKSYGCAPYSGSWNALLLGDNTMTWLFTPVYLVKGVRYVFSIYTRQSVSNLFYVGVGAYIGTAPNEDSMKQTVLGYTYVDGGDYQHLVSSFTADIDGVCWLGIMGGAEYKLHLSIDSISLVQEGWHAITVESEYGTMNVTQGALKDSTVTVCRTMKPGYVFTGYTTTPEVKWTSSDSSSFIMPDEDVIITMNAEKIDYSISVGGTEENGSVATNVNTAQVDDIVKLTITSAVGYTIDTILISQNGNVVAFNAEDSTFIMPAGNVEISPKFKKIDYNITVSESKNGFVKTDTTAQMNDMVELAITPDLGYDIDEITIYNGNKKVTFSEKYNIFVMPAGDVQISATFKKADYTITIAECENGSVVSNKAIAQMGDTVKLTITSDPDFILDKVAITQGKTQVDFNAEDSTFIMPADSVEISATFKKIDYTILVKESENGTVTSSDDIAQIDDIVKLNITSAVGYTLDEITISQNGDKVAFNAEDSTFVMSAGNVEISATFKKIDYSILAHESENGTVTTNATAQMDDVVKLTITPAIGYTLDEIIITQNGDKVAFNAEDSTFVMSVGNVEISATFKKIDYNITIAEAENGSVVSNKATAQIGDTVKLTITPDSDFDLDKLVITQGETQVNFNAEDSTFVMPAGDVTITATFKQSTDVEDVKVLNLYVADGRIYCEGEFRIFDLLGRDVTAMNGSLRGVYVVRTKDAFRKVIVK